MNTSSVARTACVPSHSNHLLGVVLCGGKSSRMGRNKAYLAYAPGVTFLQHAVDRLTKICDQVCISGTAATLQGTPNVPDALPGLGPAAGIAAALNHAAENAFVACVFTPVDMPDLTAQSIHDLETKWQQAPTEIVCARHPENGFIQPLVSIIPVTRNASATTMAGSQDRSIHRWVRNQTHCTINVPQNELKNINSPMDLGESS